LLVLFATLVGAAAAGAQAAPASSAAFGGPRVAAGVGILGAVPVGDFAVHVEDAGGAIGHLDVRLGRGPFRLGGEIGYLEYGHQERTVSLRTLLPDIPDATLKVNTDNGIFLMNARLRAQWTRGRWRPYADALVGFMDIFTKTSIDGGVECTPGWFGGGVCSSTAIDSTTNSRDFVPAYGAGGGASYGFRPLRLDLSLRYLRGGHARYLTAGAVRIEGSQAVFDFSESRTDSVAVYLGLAWPR
jgi:hypothetical protein